MNVENANRVGDVKRIHGVGLSDRAISTPCTDVDTSRTAVFFGVKSLMAHGGSR
jgi:hypothetical protein